MFWPHRLLAGGAQGRIFCEAAERRGEERRPAEYTALELGWRGIFTADMLGDFYHKMVNNYNQRVKSRYNWDASLGDDPAKMTDN